MVGGTGRHPTQKSKWWSGSCQGQCSERVQETSEGQCRGRWSGTGQGQRSGTSEDQGRAEWSETGGSQEPGIQSPWEHQGSRPGSSRSRNRNRVIRPYGVSSPTWRRKERGGNANGGGEVTYLVLTKTNPKRKEYEASEAKRAMREPNQRYKRMGKPL